MKRESQADYFTPRQKVELAEQGSSIHMTDEEAWKNQPAWTDSVRQDFLANLRVQMEHQDRADARIWEVDPSELVGEYLGGRLRLCIAPGCACRLLIVGNREQARKLHKGTCESPRDRQRWRDDKRKRRKAATTHGQPNPNGSD